MARKRKMRARVRGAFRGFKKRASKSGSTENLVVTMIAAGAYGALRPKIESVITPYTSKIPVIGNYGDEAVLGLAGYLLASGKMPMVNGKVARSVGKAMLVIESARVGSGLMSGLSPVSNSGSNFDTSTNWGQ